MEKRTTDDAIEILKHRISQDPELAAYVEEERKRLNLFNENDWFKLYQYLKQRYGGKRKLLGDVCVRLFSEIIKAIIEPKYSISQPNAYIDEFPYEFDLLIIRNNAEPLPYTNVFSPEDVRLGIEIKARGVFGGYKELPKVFSNMKNIFDTVQYKYEYIDFIYFTFSETVKPKREKSIKYLNKTIEGLRPYKVFCLSDSRNDEILRGELDRLKSYLMEL